MRMQCVHLTGGADELLHSERIHGDIQRSGGSHDYSGFFYFFSGAMSQQKEFIGLDRGLVLHDAVFRNADAVQARADRTQSADDDSALQGA